MKKISPLTKICLVLFVSAFICGCSTSTGQFKQATGTAVNLSKDNYRVIKACAIGKSRGFHLFGFIPITNPSYAGAKKDLYASIGTDVTDRSLALANQTEDRSSLYLVLFSIPKITISADVIEFKDVY